MGRKAFALLVAGLFLYICSPLLLPVALGGIFAVIFEPMLDRIERRRISRPWGSALVTFGITMLLLVPTSLMIFFAAKTGFRQLQLWRESSASRTEGDWITAMLNSEHFRPVWDFIHRWLPNLELQQLADSVQEVARAVGLKLADLFGQVLALVPGMVMAIAVIVVSIYFFLLDGRKLVLFFRRNSPFSSSQTEQLVTALHGICRSVVLASVASGAAQATFESVACLLTGTPNVAIIGLLVFMGSFVPLVGSAPFTLGVALQQLILAGRTKVGIVLLISAVIVGVLDNFIRPVFLKGSANLHPLLAFVAAFGGLQMLGFPGVFVGPIVAAIFMVTVSIFARSEEEALIKH